jgi:hypothetical protein
MNARHWSFVITASLALAAQACSGAVADDAEPGAPSDAEESALATATAALHDVVAVRVDRRDHASLIGAPTKVAKLMKAFRKPSGPTPRCSISPATRFTFYDVKGKSVGTASVVCFQGTIELDGGRAIKFVNHPGDLDVLDEPPVVADGLWGVTKVHAHARTTDVDFTRKAQIASLLDAVGVDQPFGPLVPVTRCPPSHTLSFYRGTTLVGNAYYDCGTVTPDTLTVNMTLPYPANPAEDADPENAPALSGSISIQAKDIDALIESAAE